MGESNKKTIKFQLPIEEVVVKFIKRKKGMASGSHVTDDHVISGGMLENAVRRFTAPLRHSGGVMNVLSNIEKEFLEKELGIKLSVYSDFWKDHSVTLRKQQTKFDLSNPMDYINIKILEKHKDKVAIGWENRNKKTTYDFVIVKKGEETRANKKSYDMKKIAWKEYSKIEMEETILRGVLKLLANRPISKHTKLEWIQNQVEKIVDESPKKFVSLVSNKSFITKLLLINAVELGVVVRSGNKYSTADGIELSEKNQIPTFDNAINFLENPKHQDVMSMIEAKMKIAE